MSDTNPFRTAKESAAPGLGGLFSGSPQQADDEVDTTAPTGPAATNLGGLAALFSAPAPSAEPSSPQPDPAPQPESVDTATPAPGGTAEPAEQDGFGDELFSTRDQRRATIDVSALFAPANATGQPLAAPAAGDDQRSAANQAPSKKKPDSAAVADALLRPKARKRSVPADIANLFAEEPAAHSRASSGSDAETTETAPSSDRGDSTAATPVDTHAQSDDLGELTAEHHAPVAAAPASPLVGGGWSAPSVPAADAERPEPTPPAAPVPPASTAPVAPAVPESPSQDARELRPEPVHEPAPQPAWRPAVAPRTVTPDTVAPPAPVLPATAPAEHPHIPAASTAPATTAPASTLPAERPVPNEPQIRRMPAGAPRPPRADQVAAIGATYARRAAEIERSWPMVDRILGLLRTETAVQGLLDRLELTSDLAQDQQQRAEFAAAIRPRLTAAGINVASLADVDLFLGVAYDEVVNISVLGDLWRDPDITEILVDRWDVITVERNGRLERTGYRFRDQNHANSVARKLAQKISDRAVSQSIPLVTAELPRARITIAFGAVVKGGLSITIRKFRELLKLDDLLAFGALDTDMIDFLRDAVEGRVGILVSGGTGTGKTTIINMLSSFIPDTERVITIEDAFELQLANTHVVSLQTKEASSRDDTVSVTLAELLRNTLRMRPDRIIVGEIREAHGAEVLLAAANTGHDGTLTTIHANSADDAVNERLTDLVAQARGVTGGAVRRSIASAFDLVLQVTRGRNGRRYISEIANLTRVGDDGFIGIEPVFTSEETADGVTWTRHGVRADTALGMRLRERGGSQWLAQ